MALQGNVDVLTALRRFYVPLSENDDFPLRHNCSSDIRSFVRQLDSFIYDSNMQIARGKLLAEKIAGRKTIVSNRRSTVASR